MSAPPRPHAPTAGVPRVAAPSPRPAKRSPLGRLDLDLARSWPSLTAAVATVGVLLVFLGYRSGGYFPADSAPVGRRRVRDARRAACGPPAALAAEHLRARCAGGARRADRLDGLSAAWSPVPDAALEDMQRDALYVAIFGLALLAAGSGPPVAAAAVDGLAVCGVIAGGGLISRLLPALIESAGGGASAEYRLAYPLTYWNALGAVASTGAVLGLGLAADPRALPWSRGLAAATSVLLTTTMYLTLSRASWLALIVRRRRTAGARRPSRLAGADRGGCRRRHRAGADPPAGLPGTDRRPVAGVGPADAGCRVHRSAGDPGRRRRHSPWRCSRSAAARRL